MLRHKYPMASENGIMHSTKCNADGYSVEKQASCFSIQAVAGASNPTFEESLPTTAPTVELAEDAIWLNVTSLVNGNTYYATYGTEKEFARSEYIHTRYSYDACVLSLNQISFLA